MRHFGPTSESDLLSLTKTGSAHKDYIHKFTKIAEKHQFYTLPMAMMAQTLTSTEVHKRLDKRDVRHLAKHMGHSVDTSLQYYEALDGVQQEVHVHKTVEAFIGKWQLN